MRSAREGAVKSAASPDIHSRCWLDLVEPGPVVLGAGFSCLFLQVWCLMLIPPHVPRVLSKHAGAGDSAGRPALPPCPPSSLSASSGGPPTHAAASKRASNRVLFSLPVIRVAALPLLFYFTLSPRILSPPWVWTPLMKGLCSHRRSTGSTASPETDQVVAPVIQSRSTVM